MKKILKQTTILNLNDTNYEVFLDVELMEKMKWSWESLIFADNNDTFAYVKDLSNNNITTLVTNGDVRILDESNNSDLLDIDKVIKLALSKDIYDDKYFVDSNNWFSLDYGVVSNEGKEIMFLEDDVFEAEPKDINSLIDVLIDAHQHYFSRN